MTSKPISILFLLSAVSTMADIRINYTSTSGTIRQSDGLTNAPATWMAQLIYAGPDDLKSPYDPTNPLVPLGDDRVLRSQRLNVLGGAAGIPGRIEGGELLIFADETMAGHYVYTRVFNVDYIGLPNAGAPASAPTLFGESALSAAMQITTVSPSSILKHSPVITVDHSTAPPGPVGIVLGVNAEGDARDVTCPLISGFYYYLETTQDLRNGPWTNLAGPIKGLGPTTIPIPANLPAPSYVRVRTE